MQMRGIYSFKKQDGTWTIMAHDQAIFIFESYEEGLLFLQMLMDAESAFRKAA